MKETHRTVKRLFSAFLCIVMILALAPMAVFADEPPVESPAPSPVPGPVTVYIDRSTTKGEVSSESFVTTEHYNVGDIFKLTEEKIARDYFGADYKLVEDMSDFESEIIWSADGANLVASFKLTYAPVVVTPETVNINYVYEDQIIDGRAIPSWSETIAYGSSYTVSSRHENIADYTFSGWKLNGEVADGKVLENVTADVTLMGSYTKNENCGKYYVEYYYESVNDPGVYEFNHREYKDGVKEGPVAVSAGSITGFKFNSDKSTAATADMNIDLSQPMKLYYTRNSYTVTYKVDGKQSGNVETYKYGQQLTLRDAPNAKKGYTFVGWDGDHALGSNNTMPACNVVFSGKMVPGSGAVYTVNVYRQNVKGDYELYLSQKRTGVVDSLTNVTAAPVDGYVLQPFTNKTIKADDSTVISVYYEMTDELAAILIATGKNTSNAPAADLVLPNDFALNLDAEELTAEPDNGDAQPADEQDTANIGEEETPLANGESGLGFNIIPFIIIGLCLVAAAIIFYVRHKKQAEENA